jgi:hypothetical protein
MPLAANSTMNRPRNGREVLLRAWPTGRPASSRSRRLAEAITITTEITCVTMEPPTLSEIQPPIGRIAAPTNGSDPGVGQRRGCVRVLQCVLHHAVFKHQATWLTPKITVIDSGSAIEKPMNEPKVTM